MTLAVLFGILRYIVFLSSARTNCYRGVICRRFGSLSRIIDGSSRKRPALAHILAITSGLVICYFAAWYNLIKSHLSI